MIFKVQRSLSPGPATVLVYNKSRSISGQFPMTAEVRKLFRELGNPPKFYFHGEVEKPSNFLHVRGIADEPNW